MSSLWSPSSVLLETFLGIGLESLSMVPESEKTFLFCGFSQPEGKQDRLDTDIFGPVLVLGEL